MAPGAGSRPTAVSRETYFTAELVPYREDGHGAISKHEVSQEDASLALFKGCFIAVLVAGDELFGRGRRMRQAHVKALTVPARWALLARVLGDEALLLVEALVGPLGLFLDGSAELGAAREAGGDFVVAAARFGGAVVAQGAHSGHSIGGHVRIVCSTMLGTNGNILMSLRQNKNVADHT